jgi:ubiquinone/menaquinone biosynthesis C-methylase UbiE
VLDIGCGPGAAVRYAVRRGSAATGVDPDPAMLRLARWSTALRRSPNVSWLVGRAEKLPVPDDSATVAWAISSAHHWEDRAAAIGEARRALAPAGRLVLAERLTKPGARGHACHGLTRDQAEDLARQLTAAGFGQVRLQASRAGHRVLVIVSGTKDAAD